MLEMREESRQACAFGEAVRQKLLDGDGAEADQSAGQRMTMKNCDAGERGGKKQKIDQHGEIVSAERRSDASGHVQVPAGLAGDPEPGIVRLSLALSVHGTKRKSAASA